jgi:hypothetical protein
MFRPQTTRLLAMLAMVALLAGALAAPAEAKKRKKKPRPCATYQSPEFAAEAETTVVTDKATEEKPIEIELSTGPGLSFSNPDDPNGGTGEASHVFHNVQVDSKAKSAGLFVRIEYLPAWDYDLFLRTPEGPSVAYEADFNPATAGGPTPVGGNEGAHPEPGAGQIDGYLSTDCDGFTVDVWSAITPGGAVAMTLWLGEPAE